MGEWMIESRINSVRSTEDCALLGGCEDHMKLANENYEEAEKLS